MEVIGVDIMYNVTLYMNTGFNSMNSPDKVSLLETAAQSKLTLPSLDIYQIQELDSVVLNVPSYSSIRDADYALIVNDQDATDFGFFSVENITMTDMHTAVVDILINPVLTVVGTTGLSALEFTDGMCSRHHVSRSDDLFGNYCEEDPFLTPAETMLYDYSIPNFKGPNDTDTPITIIETTVNLYDMYKRSKDAQLKMKAIDYWSDDDNIVTVPEVTSGQPSSYVKMGYGSTSQDYYSTLIPNATFYIPDWQAIDPIPSQNPPPYEPSNWIPDALTYIRSLGVESCIIAQYSIPQFMIANSVISPDSGYSPTPGSVEVLKVGLVDTLSGKFHSADSQLPFLHPYSHTVRNNRIYYGDNVRYNIVSIASGNKASFLPEEIYTGSISPVVDMRVDPRPDGCPYFMFHSYRGIVGSDLFFTNAVKGLNWQNVPLVFNQASGSLINQYYFNATDANYRQNANRELFENDPTTGQPILSTIRDVSDILASVGGVAGGLSGSSSAADESIFNYGTGRARDLNVSKSGISGGTSLGAALSIPGAAVNAGIKTGSRNKRKGYIKDAYDINHNTELQNLLVQNNVVAPSVNFPISESIRDFVGNTCLVYRTFYTENDVARIDKMLTMYGYRHTTPIETWLLTNRSKFNYIEAKGVSIKNAGVPKWLRDAITAQFESGVRFWHVPIDTTAYTDGSNI